MMKEFIVWHNCTNQCDFCWQCKKQDKTAFLNHIEMIAAIRATEEKILNEVNDGDDVLLVGGEILNSYNELSDYELHRLLNLCASLIKKDRIRYLYINTNLIYGNRKNLTYLLDLFNGIEDRLKFTTSYDVYGRFKSNDKYDLWVDNMIYIRDFYPNINMVVNIIITKQLVNWLEEGNSVTKDYTWNSFWNYQWNSFQNFFKIKYINFIPYIPVEDDRSMDVTFKDIVKVLAAEEKRIPGYINKYIDDFDLNQDKILYEYHKDKGYVECTAKYSDCHHNENFKKVLGGECYICKLKEIFR